jgi:hypothetical protein
MAKQAARKERLSVMMGRKRYSIEQYEYFDGIISRAWGFIEVLV